MPGISGAVIPLNGEINGKSKKPVKVKSPGGRGSVSHDKRLSVIATNTAMEWVKSEVDTADSDRPIAADEVEAVENKLAMMGNANKFLFNPDGKFCQNWDMVIIIALVFTATITPYEVAFVEGSINAMFAVNRFVDAAFLCDMTLQFFLMYKDSDGKLVRYRWWIARRYLMGWFGLDFLTILPYDSVKYFVTGGGDLMFLRLIRLARLLKLLRLLRASRIFERWELRLGMQHSVFLTIKLVVTLIMANHWMACCWGLTAFLQNSTAYTWLSAWLDGQHTTTAACTTDVHEMTNAAYRDGCFHHTDVYVACLHWSMMTITSIGYGDIVPQNSAEYAVCVIFMLFAGVSWAQIIGDICSIAAQGDPVDTEYYQKSDDMNRLMSQMKLEPQSLRIAVRELILRSKNSMAEQSRREVLKSLTGSLAGEVSAEGPRFLRELMFQTLHVPCRLSNACIAAILTSMRSVTVPPIESLPGKDRMYVLRKGTVCLNAERGDGHRRLLLPHWAVLKIIMKSSQNTTWNADMFAVNPALRSYTTARTLSYVDADYIEKHVLLEVMEQASLEDKRAFRINTLFCVLKTGMIYCSTSCNSFPSGAPVCQPDGTPICQARTLGNLSKPSTVVTPSPTHGLTAKVDGLMTKKDAQEQEERQDRRVASLEEKLDAVLAGMAGMRTTGSETRSRLPPLSLAGLKDV